MNATSQIQLRHLFKVFSGSTPESGKGFYWDGDINWVTPEDVSSLTDGYKLHNTKRKITEEGYENSGVKIVPENSIVLTKRAPIGLLAILGVEACSNQGCFLLVPKEEVVPEFYYYYLLANKEYLQILGRGSTFMELSQDDLKALKVPCLKKEKQFNIASFLDRKTKQIDDLIEEREKQLNLLSEKRRALITQAVTKGINSKVKRKNSGINWLGEIPEHWEIERTKWLFRERNTRSQTGEEELLTVSHITGVTLRSEKDVNMFEAETTEGYKVVYENDLVINTLWAWMGAMGVAPVDGIVSPAYHVYEPLEMVLPGYIDAIVRMPVFAKEVTKYSKGVWSSRLRLYPEGLYEVYLPVPPIEEQSAILEFIQAEQTRIDEMSKITLQSIELLKERRISLITEAVAGKLNI